MTTTHFTNPGAAPPSVPLAEAFHPGLILSDGLSHPLAVSLDGSASGNAAIEVWVWAFVAPGATPPGAPFNASGDPWGWYLLASGTLTPGGAALSATIPAGDHVVAGPVSDRLVSGSIVVPDPLVVPPPTYTTALVGNLPVVVAGSPVLGFRAFVSMTPAAGTYPFTAVLS
jgi:hypothetical protein